MIRDQNILDQLLETVTRFVSQELIPHEAQVAEQNEIPAELVDKMAELGLFGLSIPTAYGGLGLTMEEECLVALELGQTSPAFRTVVGTNIGIGSQGLIMDGRPDQKDYWLPRLASGEVISSFALTEPEAGSDAGSIRTTAVRDGDCYRLNGTKRYITNADKAGLFTLMARTDPESQGSRGVSAFLIPAQTPGLSIGLPEKKMGQHGTHVCDVVLNDAEVPASALLGTEEGKGFITAMKVLERGRLHISAVCVGIADRLIDESTHYAAKRKQFGQAIGEFQLVQGMLADMKTEWYAGRSMVIDAARKKDLGEAVATESSCCKYFCSEMVGRVADHAVQIFGGAGYIADYGIERFYRDVRIFRLYEGTSQIQQLIIARNMLRELTD
ncbi:MAG TPA: acyl-CoA dehydrogenase [Gammaproteobacteria bacterium]|nr:acyl-CoA dehydrogenase family protein [Gammaproteobacteria bacterium]PHS10178.1 MAG: acyl-CoA dehydrogenase [Acidithiobacillus sp.]RUA20627.1 MAG: acyl-CoA dehydrogenase [Chloroflexota bacterium]RTZ62828.1 MAG: acyl-CoA dehydrogenase [Gammaproteobacteria bacterium]HAD37486.1 acyl-CoA dehydrogenase [Gammaproteobacteria bacterium]